MTPYNDERDFNTADELFQFFAGPDGFRSGGIFEATTVGMGRHIFRGQSDATWSITPSVFRQATEHPLINFATQLPGPYDQTNHDKWVKDHLHAELYSIKKFLETADKLGITTPINYHTYEKAIKDNIETPLNYENEFPSEHSIIEGMTLAQHHGVPTRLIDWSEYPWVACFFAAYNASSLVAPPVHPDSKIAIFCLRIPTTSNNKIKLIEAPRHRNNFLRLQKGLFTHIPTANSYFLKHKKWPSLEDIIDTSDALKKYTLPSTEADNLLKILFDLDITKHHLMPTLDNIANSQMYIIKLFKKL